MVSALTCLLAATALLSSSLASISLAHADEHEIVFEPPLEPTQEMQGQVIGGVPASPVAWPATLVFKYQSGRCTATVVGAKVVLTAAHCINNNAEGRIRLNNVDIKVTCEHHPAYPGDISADFALCFADAAIPTLPFEVVNANPALLFAGRSIQLLGYGCRAKDGVDKNFGSLFEGTAKVSVLPDASSYFTRANGGAAVCFGDSGGGAFTSTNPTGTTRALFAVNSRGDISQNSWLSTTSHLGFRNWATARAKARNAAICGLHATAQGCRGE